MACFPLLLHRECRNAVSVRSAPINPWSRLSIAFNTVQLVPLGTKKVRYWFVCSKDAMDHRTPQHHRSYSISVNWLIGHSTACCFQISSISVWMMQVFAVQHLLVTLCGLCVVTLSQYVQHYLASSARKATGRMQFPTLRIAWIRDYMTSRPYSVRLQSCISETGVNNSRGPSRDCSFSFSAQPLQTFSANTTLSRVICNILRCFCHCGVCGGWAGGGVWDFH